MSMYWSGNCISGLLLEGKDIDHFVKKYIEINPWEFKHFAPHERESEMYDWLNCNEQFKYACDGGGNFFYAQMYSEDHFEGLYFLPAKRELEVGQISLYNNPVVFIEAKKPLISKFILSGSYYGSYEEMEDEFREKLGAYLPTDFDYENAIGDLSYACYA